MENTPRIIEIHSICHAQRELEHIGCDQTGITIMAPKANFKVIKLRNVSTKAANLLKQTMLAKGGDAAVSRQTADLSVATTDVLVMGTLKQYRAVVSQLRQQPWGLPNIAQQLEATLGNKDLKRKYVWKDRELELGKRTIIMGILNITPDSFSDGGKYNGFDAALMRAEQLIEEGADIIDIGGESTRPYGAQPVSANQEMERVLPVIERLSKSIAVPISIDTYKSETAREAIKAGAHMVNDIWGLQNDPLMAKVVAEFDVPVVVMHNRTDANYHDLMGEISEFLYKSIKIAYDAGVAHDNIVIDPGIGFGKTKQHNLAIMRRLNELEAHGCPILLGTSRKAFIGTTLDLPPVDRVEGTAATVSLGIAKGAHIVRVHDVKQMKRIAVMTDAMLRCDEYETND